MNNRKLHIFSVMPTGHTIGSPDALFHNLYRVTLKNGEIWAVDPTGAQYGNADSPCPWHDYAQRWAIEINRECEFGYIRNQAYTSYGMFPQRHMIAQTMEKQELTKLLEEKIPLLAREHGGKLNAMLAGSDAIFRQAKERFLDMLGNHLKVSLDKLYSPDRIARRNKEIERQLSKNMADPERQKSLADFNKFVASAAALS